MTTDMEIPSEKMQPAQPDGPEKEFSRSLLWRREGGTHGAHLVLARRNAADLESDAANWLSEREQGVLAGFRFAKRRGDWLAGRYCAKAALVAWRGGGPAKEVEVAAGVFGQPLVRDARRPGARVGVAHAAGWGAAIAFGDDHPLGLDLEAIDPERSEVIRSQMTERELTAAAAWAPDEATRLTWLWTAKEALSKALGTGLLTPLAVYEVTGIGQEGGWLTAEFSNFGQYRVRTTFFAGMAFSIVAPKRSEWDLTAAEITAALG